MFPWSSRRIPPTRLAYRSALASALTGCASPPPLPAHALLVAEGTGEGTALIEISPEGTRRRLLLAERLVPGEADPRGELAVAVVADDAGERLVTVRLGSGQVAWRTDATVATRAPVFTPDGARVVFESSAASYRDLWRIGRAGDGLTRLTEAPGGSFDPSPGPDDLLASASSRTGDAEIWIRERLVERQLTRNPGEDLRPRLSPAGDRVAWLRAEPGKLQVWVASTSGGEARRLVEGPEANDLAWSPDGHHLAVTEGAGDEARVVVIDAAGRRGASVPVPGATGPRWSPDGAWIAAEASRGEVTWVVLWHPDSGARRAIGGTEAGIRHGHPRWVERTGPAAPNLR